MDQLLSSLSPEDVARFGETPAIRFAENLQLVQERIAAAALRSGRRPEDVRLLPVTKTVPAHILRYAFAAGITDLAKINFRKPAINVRNSMIWRLTGALSVIYRPTRSNISRASLQSFMRSTVSALRKN